MNARVAVPLAWSVCALSVTFAAFGLFFLYLNGSFEDLLDESLGIDAVLALSFPTVGAIIASHRPSNAVGWIFCAIGLCGGVEVFTVEYGIYALVTNPGSLPAGVIATWIGTWVWLPSVTLTISFLLLLFPHGRLLSSRWRPVAWLAASVTIAGVVLLAIVPWDLLEPGVSAQNPVGVENLRYLGIAPPAPIFLFGIPTMLLCVASLVLRFRRSRGEERQQLKWFVSAGVLIVGALFVPLLVPGAASSVLQLLVMPLLPVAVGVAIMRYRLYEIDLLINRTLVYGALTALLAAVYVASVVSLQGALRALTGQESQLAVVASTLLIAAIFNPLRRRIQALVDRRFYRRKYDARKTLEAFSAKLRNETDLDTLSDDLVGVVRETMQPAHVSLWLRPKASPKGAQAD
jgi:FtsH-binding integral membrane protein